MNEIAQVEFELSNFETAVQHRSYNAGCFEYDTKL